MQKKNAELFKKIEEYIDAYKEKNGASPSVREIADELGVNYSTVSRYLKHMRENGMLDYEGHRNITTRESRMTKTQTVKVAVLGAVSCGVPKFAEENIEEYVRLPVALFVSMCSSSSSVLLTIRVRNSIRVSFESSRSLILLLSLSRQSSM